MADALWTPDELVRVLQDLADDVRAGYVETLGRNERRASGALIDSVTSQVKVNGTTYEVSLNLQDYWIYVEEDTKPHWPPQDAILRWIQVKPIIPRPDENGRIPKPEQLAFLIRRAIAGKSPNQANLKNPQGGTTGTHDLQKTKDAILPYYEERLVAALERDTLQYIEKITN